MLALAASVWAQTPAQVLLVVNSSSPLSRQIGAYYARKRALPAANLCALAATTEETISRAVYEEEIARPVAAFLKAQDLVESVLYVVTTAGLPLRVAGTTPGRMTDAAAVDSELTMLYARMHGKSWPVEGPLRNPFFGRRDAPFRRPQFPIYLVTRLAGYDLADVQALIDRSAAAVNRGKFVVDLNSPEQSKGNGWLRAAALLLPKERVLLDETREVLYGQQEVIGYAAWGSNDPDRKLRFLGFRWLPGAIVTEFVSTNGRTFARPPDSWNIGPWSDKSAYFSGAPQTLTADYIHEGTTGASGHVQEPYLEFSPRPDYLLPAWWSGRNLAESYYLALPALSWQNIVVGDPLCRLK